MRVLTCSHCNGIVKEDDKNCSHCGIPLPPNHGTQREHTFIYWFVALVIFCVFMMMWLPPDWSPL